MMVPRNVIQKRSATVSTPALVGVIVGAVAVINVVILLAWRMMTRERRRRRRLRISAPIAVEHEAAKQALQMLTDAKSPTSEAAAAVYTTLPRAHRSNSDRRTRRVKSPVLTIEKISIAMSDSPSGNLSPRFSNVAVEPPKKPPVAVISRNVSRRKSLDAETASVYSSLSAPLEYHEKLFSAPLLALDPSLPKTAPAWIVTMTTTRPPGIKYPALISKVPKANGSPPSSPRHSHPPPLRRPIPPANRPTSQTSSTLSSTTIPSPSVRLASWTDRTTIPSPRRILWRTPSDITYDNSSVVQSQTSGDARSIDSITTFDPPPLPPVSPLRIRRNTDARNDAISGQQHLAPPALTVIDRSPEPMGL